MKRVQCIQCGYLFAFSDFGVDLANKEYDPEVLRRMPAEQLGEIRPEHASTMRNYVLREIPAFRCIDRWTRLPVDPEGTRVGRHTWSNCSYVGCYSHRFEHVDMASLQVWKEDVVRGYKYEEVDVSQLARITHAERDCDAFVPYQEGLSAKQHEGLERLRIAEQQKGVKMGEQLISGGVIAELYMYLQNNGGSYNDLAIRFRETGISSCPDVEHTSTRRKDMFLDEYIRPLNLSDENDARKLVRFIRQVIKLPDGSLDPQAQQLVSALREDGWDVVSSADAPRPLRQAPSSAGRATKVEEPTRILLLAANPKDTPQLRLDEEVRAIDVALLQTEYRDRFDLRQQWAVRPFDIQGHLLRYQPHIVHFSGHGSPSSEIMLEDVGGQSHPVSPGTLGQLFSVLKDNVRCVVLNACYSEQQARAIAEQIDCVIGMGRAISDPAAIAFAAAFYQGLGYGRSVKTAFDLGCLQIDLSNLGEQDTPRLLAVRADPGTLVFV